MSGPARSPLARNAVTVALYTAVAVVFTWPLAADPLGQHVSRHFDHYGVMWASAAVDTVDGALRTDLSRWPLGKSLLRADSFVLLGLARILAPLGLSALAAPFCALGGPILSAWAAERVAVRTFGARWPWSILAGLAFGYSGLGMTALLEGHDYALFVPWLPLLAERVVRATGPDAQVRDGLLAGLYWALSLLTTAYVGIAATLLAAALLLRGLAMRHRVATPPARPPARPPPRGPLLAAALVATPVLLAYTAAFAADGVAARQASDTAAAPRELMAAGAARLGTLLAWSPSVDLVHHSVAPSLGLTAVVLALVAPRVLRGQPGWRVLLGGAVATVALSLGPRLNLSIDDINLPWVLAPFTDLPGATLFRFPSRLLWIAALGFGLVAARVATRLAEGAPVLSRLLLLFGVVDVFVATGAPLRGSAVPLTVPAGYAATPPGLPILEVYPSFYGHNRDLDLAVGNLLCSYQAAHHRPVMQDCLTTTLRTSPGHTVKAWLMNLALAAAAPRDDATLLPAETTDARARLAAIGLGAVVLHPDLYVDADRAQLLTGLVQLLGAPTADTRDGGERLVVWALPTAGARDRVAAEAGWRATWGAP